MAGDGGKLRKRDGLAHKRCCSMERSQGGEGRVVQPL